MPSGDPRESLGLLAERLVERGAGARPLPSAALDETARLSAEKSTDLARDSAHCFWAVIAWAATPASTIALWVAARPEKSIERAKFLAIASWASMIFLKAPACSKGALGGLDCREVDGCEAALDRREGIEGWGQTRGKPGRAQPTRPGRRSPPGSPPPGRPATPDRRSRFPVCQQGLTPPAQILERSSSTSARTTLARPCCESDTRQRRKQSSSSSAVDTLGTMWTYDGCFGRQWQRANRNASRPSGLGVGTQQPLRAGSKRASWPGVWRVAASRRQCRPTTCRYPPWSVGSSTISSADPTRGGTRSSRGRCSSSSTVASARCVREVRAAPLLRP